MLVKLLILSVVPFQLFQLGETRAQGCSKAPLLRSTCTGVKNIYFITENFKATKLCTLQYDLQETADTTVQGRLQGNTTSASLASAIFLRLRTKWTHQCLFQVVGNHNRFSSCCNCTLNLNFCFQVLERTWQLIMEGKVKQSTCLENDLSKKQCKTRQCSHIMVKE